MAQQFIMKAKALVKDEIVLLLDFISKHKVLTSKATNATNNKLKEEAWKDISQEFTAVTGTLRRPEQLRLKWENLKKAARKRSALIRQNNLKTGGGKAFIPPDEVLERVASILGATCSGFTVEFGGDRVNETISQGTSEPVVEVLELQLLPELAQNNSGVVLGDNGDGSVDTGGGNEANMYTPKKLVFNTPKNALNKRRKLSEEVLRAQRDKDLALAAYFQAKAARIRLENIKLELELKQLENDNN